MAIDTVRLILGLTPTLLTGSLAGTRTYWQIQNLSAQTVFIGASGVTTSTGFPVWSGTSLRTNNLSSLHNQNIYAIAAYGTPVVGWVEAT